MLRWIGIFGAGIGVVVVTVLVFQVVSLRTGWKPGVTAVRRFNRRFTNGAQMKTAGQPGAYAAVIRHVGRNTGTAYETPVGVVQGEEGLIIALPYGTDADWLKNVLASGSAELTWEGETFAVDQPELVSSREAMTHTTRADRLLQRLYGVDQALRLRRAETRVS